MRIAIDAMGGDYAPKEIVEGAILALDVIEPADELLLVGPTQLILDCASSKKIHNPKLHIIDAPEIVGMDESPVEALRKKRNSSLRVMTKITADGQADAVISAGNTGACVAACQMKMRLLPGVKRPGITAVFPTYSGPVTVCDVGANISCKPINLYQYAVMASLYSEHVLGIRKPRIGIMSIGEEDSKGNEVVKKARELIKADPKLNFIGNLEGRDVFSGVCDVVVCEGFVGNVVLKLTESLVSVLFKVIKRELLSTSKLLAWSFGGVMKKIYQRYDYHEYGGAPLLGVNGTAIICHGTSRARTIKNAVLAAKKFHSQQINRLITEHISASNIGDPDEED